MKGGGLARDFAENGNRVLVVEDDDTIRRLLVERILTHVPALPRLRLSSIDAVELNPQSLRLSALSFHGYKWLLSGFGCGALYVAPSAIDQIRPSFVGEQSLVGDGDGSATPAVWQPGARRATGSWPTSTIGPASRPARRSAAAGSILSE